MIGIHIHAIHAEAAGPAVLLLNSLARKIYAANYLSGKIHSMTNP
jgi:hypothetical protein